jgi:hypothetical protein
VIIVVKHSPVDARSAQNGGLPQSSGVDSVLTTAEAYGRFGRKSTINRVRRGMWQQPTRGVVVTHNGPIDTATREYVALAASQSGSALGGLTALRHDGFTGFSPRIDATDSSERCTTPADAGHRDALVPVSG